MKSGWAKIGPDVRLALTASMASCILRVIPFQGSLELMKAVKGCTISAYLCMKRR